MKTAKLHLTDMKEITAEEAAMKNERRAVCPDCRGQVTLHVSQSSKVAAHFEHESDAFMGESCPRRYNRH